MSAQSNKVSSLSAAAVTLLDILSAFLSVSRSCPSLGFLDIFSERHSCLTDEGVPYPTDEDRAPYLFPEMSLLLISSSKRLTRRG